MKELAQAEHGLFALGWRSGFERSSGISGGGPPHSTALRDMRVRSAGWRGATASASGTGDFSDGLSGVPLGQIKIKVRIKNQRDAGPDYWAKEEGWGK